MPGPRAASTPCLWAGELSPDHLPVFELRGLSLGAGLRTQSVPADTPRAGGCDVILVRLASGSPAVSGS